MSQDAKQPNTEEEVNKTSPSVPEESQKAPKNTLFGTIGYDNEEAFEKFISEMTPSQAVLVLISSANYAQVRGAYNIPEAEALGKAIRKIRQATNKVESPSSKENE